MADTVTDTQPTPATPARDKDQRMTEQPGGGRDSSGGASGLGLLGLILAILALLIAVAALVLQFARPGADVAGLSNAQAQLAGLASAREATTARLGALETQVASVQSAAGGSAAGGVSRDEVTALRAEITDLRGAVSEAAIGAAQVEVLAEAAGNRDSTLAPRLVALEQSVAAISQAGIATPGAVNETNTRIDAVEQQLTQVGETLAEQLSAVQAEVGALEGAVAEQLEAQAEAASAAVQAAVAGQAEATAARLDAMQATADQMQSALDDLQTSLTGLDAQTTGMAQDIAAQSERNAASSARLLAVSRLRDALEAGRGVRAEVEAARLVNADDPALGAVLDALAETQVDNAEQVPSLDRLAADFPALWNQVKLEADLAANADNRLGQVLSRVRSMVDIQRVDGEDAILAMDGVEGQLARANLFIGQGRLDDAVAELDKIPAPLDASVADFRQQLANRTLYNSVLADLDRWSLARLASDAAEPTN